MPPIEAILVPLVADLKLARQEIANFQDNNKALDRLTKSKEAALLEADKTVQVALVKASLVDHLKNKNQELMKQIKICQLVEYCLNIKVSRVGRGLMGYLGNKGSISVSMLLHQTSFCFVYSHLTSGQKEGDELRRNSDVMQILRRTRFPRVRGIYDDKSPQTILEHE